MIDGSEPDRMIDGSMLDGMIDGSMPDRSLDGATNDASASDDGSSGVDSGDGGPSCEAPVVELPPPPTTSFGPPVLVEELNSPSGEDDPTLTADMLEIYFQSTRGGAAELWRSVRSSVGEPWPTPERVPELIGIPGNTPELSRDGRTLYFAAAGPGGDEDIFMTTRTDRSSPWSTPTRVDTLSSPQGDTGSAPFLGGHGVVLFSNRPGGPGGGDLFMASRDPGSGCSTFAEPFPVPGMVNGPGVDANPWMRADGLWLAWNGTSLAGRPSLDDPFGTPVQLTELDSGAADMDPWMNDEMTVIYFTSVRTGDVAIYRANR